MDPPPVARGACPGRERRRTHPRRPLRRNRSRRRTHGGARRRHPGHLAGRTFAVDSARPGPWRGRPAVGALHHAAVRRNRCHHGTQPRRQSGLVAHQRFRPHYPRCDRRRPRPPVDDSHPAGQRRRHTGRIAGHRRINGHTTHCHPVARGGAEQRQRPTRARPGGRRSRYRLFVVTALPRHGPGFPAHRHGQGRGAVDGAYSSVRRIAVPVAHLALRESRNPHRRTEFRVLGDRQICPTGARRRSRAVAVRHQRR